MSDSESATVTDIDPVLTISANGELEAELPEPDEDEEPEPPRLPADAVPPAAPVPDDELEEALELFVAVPVEPADIVSPGETLASDTIVPLVGAYSLVLSTAVWAFLTLASALYTDARAEAMLPGDGVVVADVELEPELPELAAGLLELDVDLVVVVGRLVVVDLAEELFGFVEPGRLFVGVVVGRTSATNSTLDVGPL